MFNHCEKLVIDLLLILIVGKQNVGQNHEKEQVGVKSGHLRPFGSHRPAEGSIDTVEGFPDPQYFYEKYISPGFPLLIKNGAKSIPAYLLWNDAYLSEKYGNEYVEVEIGKKETREAGVKEIKLQTYLRIYNESDIYMVQNVLDSMKGEITVPRSLQCGGFMEKILTAVLWFSSGGTNSVLHHDEPDNLNCILDGNKEIKFVDKIYEEDVEADGWVLDGIYSKLDVDSVDMDTFPRIQNVPWWSASMEKGDCLFIPFRWYHTVRSSNTRNLAVNLWFSHLLWFNQTDCDLHPPSDEPMSLENVTLYGLESTENLRVNMFQDFEGLDVITMEDAIDVWSSLFEMQEINEVFGLIDENHDMIVTWPEIYSLDMVGVVRRFPELFGALDEDIKDPRDEL